MIRDPSDGSVRARRKVEITPQVRRDEDAREAAEEAAKEAKRLRESREWLEAYYAKRRSNR